MPNLENFHITSSILNLKSVYPRLCIQSQNNKKKLLPIHYCYEILNCKYFKVATKQNVCELLFFLICKKEVHIWGFTIRFFDFLQALFLNSKKTKFSVQISLIFCFDLFFIFFYFYFIEGYLY